MTVHISVPLDEAQKAQLEAIAEASQESVGDLAARAVAEFLEEDAAFRAAVEVGVAAARAGEVDDFETYRKDLERRMAIRLAASKA
jgi:predicted transcriptional regulator